jgi:hypothetical protein
VSNNRGPTLRGLHFLPEIVYGIAEFSESVIPVFLFASSSNEVQVEVAIHTILYVRQVYPAEIFVRRKKYETPVFQSRHPALNEYISGAVKAIADELAHVSIFL